jgi:signal peptidase II
VIDFLMLPNWPVFNVADICIDVAAGLILLQAFRGVRIDGGRAEGKGEPRPER